MFESHFGQLVNFPEESKAPEQFTRRLTAPMPKSERLAAALERARTHTGPFAPHPTFRAAFTAASAPASHDSLRPSPFPPVPGLIER